MEPSCLKNMRLAQLETPQTRGVKYGERGLRIKSLDFFYLTGKKNSSIFIKSSSLVDDGVYTVFASFEKSLPKN